MFFVFLLALATPLYAADPTPTPGPTPAPQAEAKPKAEEAPREVRLKWDPSWSKVTPVELGVFGALGAGDIAMAVGIPAPTTPHWTATNNFDDFFRDRLRAPTQGGRDFYNTASTAIVGSLILFPVIVDAGAVAWLHDKNPKAALQMLAIDAESFIGLSAALLSTKDFVARARPYNRDCPNPNCSASDRYESFFSGHTAMAANSAALICAEHLHMRLFGGTADGITCAVAISAAATAGAMRIAADQHYATDVLTGGLIGTASGLLATELHFGFGRTGQVDTEGNAKKAVNMSVMPELSPTFQGAAIKGAF